jgi:hypothetical protein
VGGPEVAVAAEGPEEEDEAGEAVSPKALVVVANRTGDEVGLCWLNTAVGLPAPVPISAPPAPSSSREGGGVISMSEGCCAEESESGRGVVGVSMFRGRIGSVDHQDMTSDGGAGRLKWHDTSADLHATTTVVRTRALAGSRCLVWMFE